LLNSLTAQVNKSYKKVSNKSSFAKLGFNAEGWVILKIVEYLRFGILLI